jgi:hypothetical protein
VAQEKTNAKEIIDHHQDELESLSSAWRRWQSIRDNNQEENKKHNEKLYEIVAKLYLVYADALGKGNIIYPDLDADAIATKIVRLVLGLNEGEQPKSVNRYANVIRFLFKNDIPREVGRATEYIQWGKTPPVKSTKGIPRKTKPAGIAALASAYSRDENNEDPTYAKGHAKLLEEMQKSRIPSIAVAEELKKNFDPKDEKQPYLLLLMPEDGGHRPAAAYWWSTHERDIRKLIRLFGQEPNNGSDQNDQPRSPAAGA